MDADSAFAQTPLHLKHCDLYLDVLSNDLPVCTGHLIKVSFRWKNATESKTGEQILYSVFFQYVLLSRGNSLNHNRCLPLSSALFLILLLLIIPHTVSFLLPPRPTCVRYNICFVSAQHVSHVRVCSSGFHTLRVHVCIVDV